MKVSRKVTPSNWFPITVDGELLGEVNVRSTNDLEFGAALDLAIRKHQKKCYVSGDVDPLVYDINGKPVLSEIQNSFVFIESLATYAWVGFKPAKGRKYFIELEDVDADGNPIDTRGMKNTDEDKIFVMNNSDTFRDAFGEILAKMNGVDEEEAEATAELAKN